MGYRAQIIVLDWRLNEIISRFVLQEELSRLLSKDGTTGVLYAEASRLMGCRIYRV